MENINDSDKKEGRKRGLVTTTVGTKHEVSLPTLPLHVEGTTLVPTLTIVSH